MTFQNLVIAKQNAIHKSISFNFLDIESTPKDKSIYQIVFESDNKFFPKKQLETFLSKKEAWALVYH